MMVYVIWCWCYHCHMLVQLFRWWDSSVVDWIISWFDDHQCRECRIEISICNICNRIVDRLQTASYFLKLWGRLFRTLVRALMAVAVKQKFCTSWKFWRGNHSTGMWFDWWSSYHCKRIHYVASIWNIIQISKVLDKGHYCTALDVLYRPDIHPTTQNGCQNCIKLNQNAFEVHVVQVWSASSTY